MRLGSISLASFFSLAALGLLGCALHPVPTKHLQRSEATLRTARAIGAADDPEAADHLRLAQQQLDDARELILEGRNEDADWMLARAHMDAELAEALALENWTRTDAAEAVAQVTTLQNARAVASRRAAPQKGRVRQASASAMAPATQGAR